jgi:coenzyme F420 hydrogenase subunit beta
VTFRDLQLQVLDADLCASCGACAAVCPPDVLDFDVDRPVPTLRPGTDIDVACAGCSLCVDVCPGRDPRVAESELRVFGRQRTADERWTGIFRQIYQGRALDERVFTAASAGGAGTALLVAALDAGIVDAVLVVGRDRDRPWLPVPRLVDDPLDVVECAQASYCITPTLQLLRDAPYERIGMVGLACQVEAVHKMRNLPDVPAAARKLAFVIEIACASSTRRAGTEHLIENRLQLPLVEVSKMRYRDGDYPGEFAVWDQEGDRRSMPFHELVLEFKAFKTNRCMVCPDWWSGLADISIADGDPNIFKTSRSNRDVAKSSLLLTRTAVGDSLVDMAVRRGALEVTPDEFDPESSLGLQRKRHRYAHFSQERPSEVPTAPAPEADCLVVLSDDEVINGMST